MMSEEREFAASLARSLGPLYKVSLLSADGEVLASFGSIQISTGSGSRLVLPGSPAVIFIEIDARAIAAADRVLHDLASSFELTPTPLGALTHLDDAITHFVAQAEAFVGKPLEEMTRSEKQLLVRFLDERGAFSLRKSVDQVAAMLGVTRFTVYNYLDSIRAPSP